MREYRKNNLERIRAQQRDDYLQNREKRRETGRIHYLHNKESYNESRQKWHEANKDKVRVYQAKYREQNREKLRAYWQRHYQQNRERAIHRQISYVRNDPNKKMAATLRKQLNRWVKKSTGRHSTQKLLGCSFAEFRNWIEGQFAKDMCWENYGQIWHLDHIMPCSAFDLTKPNQVKICFHFSNIRPLSVRENLSKNKRITDPQLKLPL